MDGHKLLSLEPAPRNTERRIPRWKRRSSGEGSRQTEDSRPGAESCWKSSPDQYPHKRKSRKEASKIEGGRHPKEGGREQPASFAGMRGKAAGS